LSGELCQIAPGTAIFYENLDPPKRWLV